MDRDPTMTLAAANIAAAMERQKTNCAEVARRAGTGPASVSDIVRGKSKTPRLDTLRKIAEEGVGVPHCTFRAGGGG